MEAEECAECDIRMTSKRRRRYNKRLRGWIRVYVESCRVRA